ncbi:winged helix-turn-helix domain-containing protein [Halovenus rubra]|uniref:Winged helix-turn-helix domain-containing protein n=2 Tax=Halovenus rubra TaxID=869890 RepID=A0ABD5XBL2_9EURY
MLAEKFDVRCHPDHLHRHLRNLGFSYTRNRPEFPSQQDNLIELSLHASTKRLTHHKMYVLLTKYTHTSTLTSYFSSWLKHLNPIEQV